MNNFTKLPELQKLCKHGNNDGFKNYLSRSTANYPKFLEAIKADSKILVETRNSIMPHCSSNTI